MNSTTTSQNCKPKESRITEERRQELIDRIPGRYTQPLKMLTLDLTLTDAEYRLLQIVALGAVKANWNTRSYRTYADLMNCDRRTVIRMINKIVNAGYLERGERTSPVGSRDGVRVRVNPKLFYVRASDTADVLVQRELDRRLFFLDSPGL